MKSDVLWQPSAERIANARITQFTDQLREKYEQRFPDYWSLWRWSIANKGAFWREVWRFCDGIGELGERVAIDGHKMPGAQWFPDGRLNFAENLLRGFDGDNNVDALVSRNEAGQERRVTWRELRTQVAAGASALKRDGVGEGDVVASLLPNVPEAAIAMLATSAIGATWSSASPDFGAQGVLDRFAQIKPKVLFVVDGYFYSGKWNDTTERVNEIVAGLPSVERVVRVVGEALPQSTDANATTYRGGAAPTASDWDAFLENADANATLEFNRLPFNHPLCIVYSSGTTGLPKAIIHGAGGTLLQLLKEHALHGDLKPRDRLFYFSTTGWIMWNWLIAGLSQGATCLLYDGSPFAHQGRVLWDFADAERCTQFGTSAKYIDAIKNRCERFIQPVRRSRPRVLITCINA
jgi:acetoacetyl-CoA synthetase